MYKNIIFDFDGTLIDTNDLIIFSLDQVALKYINRRLTKDELNSILGFFIEEQMRMISKDNYKEMTVYYQEVYKKHSDDMTKEFPGIREMLKRLKELNCKIAIVSAKSRSGIEHGINFLDIKDYVDVIISATDVTKNKPDPEPLLKGLQALGSTKENTLFIGDSPVDILCGKNTGVKTALVDWTIFQPHSFEKIKPDMVIKNPSELIDFIMMK
jgi:pyrophosphatase PpaX